MPISLVAYSLTTFIVFPSQKVLKCHGNLSSGKPLCLFNSRVELLPPSITNFCKIDGECGKFGKTSGECGKTCNTSGGLRWKYVNQALNAVKKKLNHLVDYITSPLNLAAKLQHFTALKKVCKLGERSGECGEIT